MPTLIRLPNDEKTLQLKLKLDSLSWECTLANMALWDVKAKYDAAEYELMAHLKEIGFSTKDSDKIVDTEST